MSGGERQTGGTFKDLYVPYFDNNQSCIDGHIFMDDNNDAYLFYEWVGVVGEPWNREGYFWGMIFGVPLEEDLSISENSEHQLCHLRGRGMGRVPGACMHAPVKG